MTLPRRHIEGQVTLLTRRCYGRHYFLRPDEAMNAIAGYEIARAASRNHIGVHAAMFMSNHGHMGVSDRKAMRSEFMQHSMGGIARARNHNLKRRSFFWDDRPYGDTVLPDIDSIERKLVYTWVNPVAAGLVKRAEDWPGFKILPRDWGKTHTYTRPTDFYGRRSPETVEFVPQAPPGYEHMSLEEVIEHFETLLREAEDAILEDRRKKRKRFLGADAVLAINPFSRPKTRAPMGNISPRFATTNGVLYARMRDEYYQFVNAYRRERERWVKGEKDVCFPCGTVWLKKHARVKCASPKRDGPLMFEGSSRQSCA